jgi:hypothetical protein
MRLALISVLGIVAGACGDDSVNIGSNQDNFCDQMAAVACHDLYQCCTESEIESRLQVSDPRTELQCREDLGRKCERLAPDVRDSIKAGRVTFDAAKLDACLQAVLAPSDRCSEIAATPQMIPWIEVCSSLNVPWVGTVAVGGACVFQFDCAGAPDTFCGPDLKCKMKPTAGFPCNTFTNPCASAYYCQASTNTCAPKLAVGAACLPGTQCDKDLFCDSKGTIDTSDDVCAPKGAGGASCTATSSTTANAACISGQCNPGTCTGTAFSCYSNSQCGGRCSLSNASCTATYPDCNPSGGQCSGNAMSCTNDTTCANAAAGTCLFTQTCMPTECVGDVVCTSTAVAADYCIAPSALPSP